MRVAGLTLAVTFITMASLEAQPAYRLKDINPAVDTRQGSEPSGFVRSGPYVYFVATDYVNKHPPLWRTDGTAAGTVFLKAFPYNTVSQMTDVGGTLYLAHRNELWKSDGSPSGTVVVKRFCDGALSSCLPVQHLTEFAGQVYFAADDGDHGMELWRSDGTPAGTVMVRDINPTADEGSWPKQLKASNGQLYFAASSGAAHGEELWVSDGTGANTRMVRDVNPGTGGSHPASLIPWSGGVLFLGFNPTYGQELWKTDGTEAGTTLVKDIAPGAESSSPVGLTPLGAAVLFTAREAFNEYELWKTDGTEAGTVRVADIYPGISGSNPNLMASFQGAVYFSADEGATGRELWKTDGTEAGTVLVRDIYPGSSHPSQFASAGGLLFFSATDDLGYELWKTDGTPAGTTRVKDIAPGFRSALVSGLTALGDRVVFRADDVVHGAELWITDGSEAGTQMVRDLDLGAYGSATELGVSRGETHFFTADDGVHGPGLWITDGTQAGTVLLDPAPGGQLAWEMPGSLATVNGAVFFCARSPDHMRRVLWKTDGTVAGTVGLAGSPPAHQSAGASVAAGDLLLFSASTPETGGELWRSDGTPAGTVRIADIYPGISSSNPIHLTALGNEVFFAANAPDVGEELWASDGTEEGTRLVKDIRPGGLSSQPSEITAIADAVLVRTSGAQVWSSDGTTAGTNLAASICGAGCTAPDDFTAHGTTVYFTAEDPVHGRELWRSDGSDGGVLVRDIKPGPESSNPARLVVAGDVVFFVADDAVSGSELWKTDGTNAGTVRLADLVPGPGSGVGPAELPAWTMSAAGGRVLFAGYQPPTGREVWESDGTEVGTRLLHDLVPGPESSEPGIGGFKAAGKRAIFVANDGVTGWEPWAVHLGGIFKDGFESGTTTYWSTTAPSGTDLTVTPDAALGGSNFGLRGVVNDTAPLFVQDDSPTDEDVFRARFRLDPSAFDPGEASGHYRARVFIAFEEAPVRRLVALVLKRRNGVYSLMGRVRQDDNTQADTGFFDFGAGEHEVTVEWRRSSGPDALDGQFAVSIDGVERSRLADLDIHRSAVDFVRLGAMNLKAGANGSLAWDAYESRRDNWPEP